MREVNYSDLQSLVGQETGVSDWVEITQERVNKFAEATGDYQWIHLDVERAKTVPFLGGTIAHGFLTLSLIPGLSVMKVHGVTHSINYGLDKVRFISMVHVGKRVRMRQKMLSAEPKSGGLLIKSECTIELEGSDKPACIAETLGLVFGA